MIGKFDFEKLEVYQLALEFLDFIFGVCKKLPVDLQYCLGDNLKRAGISISNNLAEGSGKNSGKEKVRYYCISSDSARECMSMLNILNRQKSVTEETYLKGRDYVYRLTSMLYKLIGSVERGKR